ncbi:hypothetical protein FA95DRAFT_397608 [Auriscalpium vulgare]|uniref:Uncharacterized protein n=1 Tax=Auriscalpium vulgare TaxID=40419 RepID=A0ACB8RHU9_9AGAM|nr:hypothetical protein FA95DRAFT_397608 [Auriscalpium vulgare]
MRVPAVVSSVFAFATLAAAQNQNVQVVVGGSANTQGGALQFIPDNINATQGSVITFSFAGSPGFHSITQSSFASPCQPLTGGFDSGFVSVPAGTTGAVPSWNLTITNGTQPIWFYCKQLSPVPHCKSGMVGAINAPTTGNTFSNFQQAAVASSGNPGQAEGGLVGVGASASAPPGPFSGAVSGVGNPTAAAGPAASSTAPASSASAPAGSTSAVPNGASAVGVNGVVALMAALLGVAIA